MELIRKGSVKEILRMDQDTIAFRFTDAFSIFDCGPHPQTIPGKGKAICECAVTSFEIAQRVGVPTHFLEQINDVTILVKEARVITDRSLKSWEENYVVPLEWISRFAVAGSLLRDFREGKEKPSDYGFHRSDVPGEGVPLCWPVHQTTTKFEKVDRKLTFIEGMSLAGLSLKDVAEFWSMIDRLDGALGLAFQEAGFVHFDGKKECALGLNRQKMIVDVFGTPDEDRPVLLEAFKQGKIEHYGKEFLRQRFIASGFYAQVQQARKEGRADPPYPLLPQEVVEEASRRYRLFASNYGVL